LEEFVVKHGAPILVLATIFLSGCFRGPVYQRPVGQAPPTFRGQAAADSISLADQAWWNIYSDPLLVALIKEALKNNYNLRSAIARTQEAHAYAGVVRSAYYPSVDYHFGVQRDLGTYRFFPALNLPAAGASTQNLYVGGLTTAWEIDLWGRIRNATAAANATYLGTEEARRGIMLSLVSDVAAAYLELLELDRRLYLAQQSRDAFQATYKLFSERFGAGIASKLQVTRAESALAAAEGTIVDIERQIAEREDQICVLVGRNPGPIQRSPPELELHSPPMVPAPGIPSQLLERRPDIRQAEDDLRAALANIGVANANFFPRIGLTTLFGRVSTDLSSLTTGSSDLWSLAASASGPIFTGGRLTKERRAAKAVFDQARFQYSQIVLRAFQEVSDALIASQKLGALEEQQKREVSALTESVAIANRRYLGGLASYYEVLEAQQLLYPAEFSLFRTSRDRRLVVVQLYKALGGGWSLDNAQFTNGH
jgi:multidrug efflux system outer membrane protein